MSNTVFYVPKLRYNSAWLDWRSSYPGGNGWRYDRSLSKIFYAANHHSVTNPTGNAKKDVDTLWNIHKANGWGGIGYNFVITSEEVKGKDGLMYAKVAYVGDIGSVRAHTTNAKGVKNIPKGYGNEYIVAACMIGQLHLKNPTAAQIRSAHWLYRELIQEEGARLPNLKGALKDRLTSHKDWDYTECSGNWAWQKGQIVNYKDPVKVTVKYTDFSAKRCRVVRNSTMINIPSGTKYSTSRVYEVGEVIEDIVQRVDYSDGKSFYRTKYARDSAKSMYGFPINALEEVKAPIVTTKDVTITKTIEFRKISIEDHTFRKGVEIVSQHGVDGILTQLFTVTYTDGKETARKLKSENITSPAVDQITRIGTLETIDDIEKRVSTLEKIVQSIIQFLTDMFKNFKIGK